MTNVILLGDSIRLGYQDYVREYLGDGFQVFSPAENCRYTKFTLSNVKWWMHTWGNPSVDVIHWNNGIWDLHRHLSGEDLFTPLDEYLETNGRLLNILKLYTDKLIWGTITPGGKALDEQKAYNALINTDANHPALKLSDAMEPWNADIRRYNEATAELMKANGVRVDDIYSVVAADPDRYIDADGIHMTDDGYKAIARQVSDEIRGML